MELIKEENYIELRSDTEIVVLVFKDKEYFFYGQLIGILQITINFDVDILTFNSIEDCERYLDENKIVKHEDVNI